MIVMPYGTIFLLNHRSYELQEGNSRFFAYHLQTEENVWGPVHSE